MKPFKVVVVHVGGYIFLHIISRWMVRFQQPVVLQATKEPLCTALSQQAPVSPIDCLIQSLLARFLKLSLVYCEPLSLWNMTFLGRFLSQ